MNLDTAAAFMTPIMLYAARALGADEAPFLYGAVLTANAASLYLPGSNLTNLLVEGGQVSGLDFLGRTAPAALAATTVTALGLLAYAGIRDSPPIPPRRNQGTVPPFGRPGPGCAAVVVAALLVVALREPALPVLVAGGIAAVLTLDRRAARDAVGPVSLAGLFVLAVAVGTLAREVDLAVTAGRWATAALGAGASVTINNLPAAALLSAHPPTEPLALLVGLNLGPNLAITGSLSALIWWRAARRLGARPSALRYSLVGAPLALAAMVAALLSLPG